MKRALFIGLYVTIAVLWVRAFVTDWQSAGLFMLLLVGSQFAFVAVRAMWRRQRRA